MTRPLTDLPWVEREPEVVDLGPPEQLYEDRLPLSDLLVAPSGATCCLRRAPNRAEVVVWRGLPAGEPVSWTGAPGLPLLEIFGFDGTELFGRSETSLLRIREGSSATLHDARARIGRAALSPDRRRILWIEQGKGRLHSRGVDAHASVDSLENRQSCLEALWLADGNIIASQLHSARGAETGQSLLLCDSRARPLTAVFETRSWVVQLLRSGSTANRFLVGGSRHGYPRSGLSFRWKPPPQPDVATWSVTLGDPPRAVCLTNADPAGGTVAVVGDTCLFADARRYPAESSLLLAASPSRVRAAVVPAPLRDFAVSGHTLLFRTLGSRFAVYSLSLEAMLREAATWAGLILGAGTLLVSTG